jgi:hypothetical protein
MKRIVLALLLAFTGYLSFAQDYSKFKLNVFAKKVEDNKKELDKLSADPKAKDKAETYFWQFATYANIYYDSTLSAKYPGADSIAFAALDIYTSKDTGLAVMKENNTYYPTLDYLKQGAINVAIKGFSSQNWDKSLAAFIEVDKVDQYKIAHRFAKGDLDTSIVFYTGAAAQNGGKDDIAVTYYRMLADQKIKFGSGSNMYTFIVLHYLKNGDTGNFTKYLAAAKALYPDDEAKWQQLEMQNATANSSLNDLMTKYAGDVAGGKLTEEQFATYGDAFSQPDKKQAAQLDSASKVKLKLSAADAYSHAFKINNNPVYAYNIGVLYYNIYDEELGSRFYSLRGESPALKAARADVERQQNMYADSSISYLTQSYTILKAKTDIDKREKGVLGNSIKDLANLYQWKEDKARGVDPKAVDKYEALYKQFDAEADKY